jgi:uncharacterized protein
MKFVVFVDLHQDLLDLEVIKENSKDVNFLICLGDFTIFGKNQKNVLKLLNNLNKKLYLIHGNHEIDKELIEDCKSFKNIDFVHKKMIEIGNKLFIFHGGGGFSIREHSFKRWINKNKDFIRKFDDIILATHAPPFGTFLDLIDEDWHVGVKDYLDFIKEFNPLLAVSGHIHETYKCQQVIGKTLLVNPGGDGEVFEID